jgi:hypothetical protein
MTNLQPGFSQSGHSDDQMKREAPIAGALIWIFLVVCVAALAIFLIVFFWSTIKDFLNNLFSFSPLLASTLNRIQAF